MNRLKTGQILKVPSADDVSQLEKREVNKEIRTHVADWKSYREQLAGGVASLPTRPDSSNVASGRVSSAAVTPPAPPAAESKDVLKLSKSEAGKAGAGKGAGASQERLNALQEEVIAKDKALKEAQSRVVDLEKQIRDMQRLIDLRVAAKAAAPKAPIPRSPPSPWPRPRPPSRPRAR